MMTFDEYLLSKKIDKVAFQLHEAERYQDWALLFAQLHPESFTTQKKFLLNDLRRRYLLKP